MVERGSQDKWPVESQPERGHMYRYAEYIYTNICICKNIYIYIKGFIYINTYMCHTMQRLHHNERQFWFIINFLNINSKCPDCKPSVCASVCLCVHPVSVSGTVPYI